MSVSTASYSKNLSRLKNEIEAADAIIIGAGAGLSTAAGLTYSGERFEAHFADFHKKYGITDMYAGGFYPFPDFETYWAWWSRHIYYNRYEVEVGKPYFDLLKLVEEKDYFVLTTNADHQFQLAGFDKHRLFYTQGDYGLFQCSEPCHKLTYDNEFQVREMVRTQKDMRIPTELIPRCPKCGKPMTMNLRCDNTFVEDGGWMTAASRYDDFLRRHKNLRLVLLELGVGGNTPVIIKYPFWQMTSDYPNTTYACVNLGEALCPKEIAEKSICINADIARVLGDLVE